MKLTKVTKDGSRSIYGQFLTMTILPLVLSGIVMILSSSYFLKNNILTEADDGLRSVAVSVLAAYDNLYPGEYEAKLNEEGNAAVLYKGDVLISEDTALIDGIKEETNLDISIFFYDTRLLTTLTDEAGNRLTGSVASNTILSSVYNDGQEMFYSNVAIGSQRLYAYYCPIREKETGDVVGMIGVAKPATEVLDRINRSIIVNVLIVILAVCVTGVFIVVCANNIVTMIKCMIDFMKKIAANDLDASLDERVTHRDDEFGVMGRILVDLQISLRRLIERDVLTGLYNRRSAEKKIDRIEKEGLKYCVCIGDIDHFKKFNDTFGHECGDVVLKEVAATLKSNMNGRGFVARWGGEEFLLVYENMDINDAYVALMGIREELHEKDINYQEQVHKVTMTFGVAQKTEGIPINQLIRLADDKLYEGKQNGRDRVIK